MKLLGQPILFAFLIFPIAAFADLAQTVTLSTSGQTNLNLDTGATSTSGGDIQWTGTNITPQTSATAVSISSFSSLKQFSDETQLVVQLFPGYSKTPIPYATLSGPDLFGVHTNGGHYAKVFVSSISATSITLMFNTYGVSGNGSSSGPPTITGILNNSSGIPPGLPNSGIAPSSIFIITGTGLAAPGDPVLQDSTKGIPLTLNGASISVTVNGTTTHPPIYYTSPTQIAAVLPAATPIGNGTLTVTYSNIASTPAPIQVVAAAPGINIYNSNTAVATDAITYSLLTYANSGTPGETIVLWTTGLGADPSDSDTSYTTTPHAVNTSLKIYIGGIPATILYQGSAGYPGVNQINLTIPQSAPNGCWVSVAAIAGGVLSNIATLPINNGGGACLDQVRNLTASQFTSSGSLRTGLIDIVQSNAGTSSDAAFEKYTGIDAPTSSVSPGSCIVSNLTVTSVGTIDGLDPGALTVTPPTGSAITLGTQFGIKGAFFASLIAIPQTGGMYTFKGAGGADVGSFTSSINFTNPILNWTNMNVGTTVDRSKDLKVTWTGGNPGTYVFISGTSTSPATASTPSAYAGYTCLTKADDGQFTVPSYILSALPVGSGGMAVQNDIYSPLMASGLDIGLTLGNVSMSTPAKYN